MVVALLLTVSVLVPVSDQSAGEDTLAVVVLAGQSNITYISEYMDVDVVNEEVAVPEVDCYYFGTAESPLRQWVYDDSVGVGLYSMLDSDRQWRIGGEECAIASAIGQKSNCDVLTINVGISGQMISHFLPTNAGGVYIDAMLSAALDLIPNHYRQIKCGWVWCQGESDRTTSVESYVGSFGTIRENFAEWGFNTCYLVQTAPDRSGNATEAQLQCVSTYSDVILASTAPSTFTVANGGLIEGNTLHYTQHGRDGVGAEVGAKIASGMTWHTDNSSLLGMIHIIPLIVIVGLVLGAVGMFISRRD